MTIRRYGSTDYSEATYPLTAADTLLVLQGGVVKYADLNRVGPPSVISIAVSDESTALTTGTAKVTFRMPFAMTLLAAGAGVRLGVTTAPTGATLLVDVNVTGSGSIFSTRPQIDATEKTSTTAATAPVITDTTLDDDAEITIDIDQVGSTIAGAGLKVHLIGYPTA